MTIGVQHPCTDLGEHIYSSKVGAESTGADSSTRLDVVALTRGMACGDEKAYRTFYDAYFNRLSRYLLVVAGGAEDAAREALQATLVRVVRHARIFPDETSFWNWLTVLARSAFKDQRKKHRRYFAFLDRFTQHAHAQSQNQDDGVAETRLMSLLENTVAALPADERDLLERKYFAAQPVREIAEELHASEKAVESKLVRVRRKLKHAMLTSLKHESPD